MDKRKATDLTLVSAHKRKRTGSDISFKDLAFTFDSGAQDCNDEFEEEVAQGGHYKSAEFWLSNLVRNTGSIQIRPSKNDYTDQIVYYLRREYNVHENKPINVKPSIVELERRYFPELNAWLQDRFIEHNEAKPGEMIALLEKNKEFATQKKTVNGTLPDNFFKNPVTLVLGEFRIRPHYHEKLKATVFTFNSARTYEQNTSWNGPTISGVAIGEVKRILRAITEFEENF